MELGGACVEPQHAKPGAKAYANPAEFVADYCRVPRIDWSQVRLVALQARQEVIALDVVFTATRVNVIAVTRDSCDGSWGTTPVLLLVPASDLPVVLFERPSTPPECPDGYGY